MDEIIENHLDELKNILHEICCDPDVDAPSRRSTRIFNHLKHKAPISGGIGHTIRQVHNFYGWKAANKDRGQCSGTLYRTRGYLEKPPEKRDGSKGPGRNIHLEHTVPVNVLEKNLRWNCEQNQQMSEQEFHRLLIDHSICTAFSHTEQNWLGQANVPHMHNGAFCNDTGARVHDYPFRRYLPLVENAKKQNSTFEIYNIINGEQIDLEKFTFADHVDTLKKASQLTKKEHLYYL